MECVRVFAICVMPENLRIRIEYIDQMESDLSCQALVTNPTNTALHIHYYLIKFIRLILI